jgi:hypothetical protein
MRVGAASTQFFFENATFLLAAALSRIRLSGDLPLMAAAINV